MTQAWKTADVSAGTRLASLRRADALIAVAERFLSTAPDESDAGPPVEVVVHVDADTLGDIDLEITVGATLDDGTALPRSTAERLACDAAVVEVVEDSRGNVLDVGRRRRTIPTLLRRALRLRDHGCRFPGCTNRRVDGHHVVPWSRGGATGGGFIFFHPDGREVAVAGVPLVPGPHPVEALRAQALGLSIDATTNTIRWDGRPADYDQIVWSLMPPPALAEQ